MNWRDKELARHREHGVDDPDIGDVAGAYLTVDHFLARRRNGHGRTLKVERRGRRVWAGTASSLVQGSPKRNMAIAPRPKPARLAARGASDPGMCPIRW